MNSGNLFGKALQDFLSIRFMAMTTVPFIATLVLGLVVLGFLSGEFFDLLNAAAQANQDPGAAGAQEDLARFAQTYPLISALLGSFVFKLIAGTLFYLIGGGIAILFSVVLAVIIVGFLTPAIVREIHRRHYAAVERKSHGSVLGYLGFMLKQFLLFLLFWFVSLPFYFVPLINLVAINAPFYFLFHRLLTRDVAGEIFDAAEAKRFFKVAKWRLMSTTLILFLISLIPLAGLLLQVFFVIVLTHQMFMETGTVRRDASDDLPGLPLA